jgi:large subunit ribosomal protein L11
MVKETKKMAKEIKAVVKVQISAGKATPAPPIGPALAPHGLNIAEFCQKFNAATQAMSGYTIPAEVTIYKDRTFTFILKTPLASELIKKAIGIEKGSGAPNKTKVGKITKAQLKEVAMKKMPDLNTTDIEQAIKIIAGTAKNMGVDVIN